MEGLRGLTGHQVVGVLRERYAEAARVHASMLEAVWETVRCDDANSTHRLVHGDEFSADEVRAALGLTRKAAMRLVCEAHDVIHRLPELGEAMAAGELDAARARLIGDWLTELSDDHAHQVCALLLPKCRLSESTRLTTGQLIDEIKTLAVALDPEWSRRRYERGVRQRRISAARNGDGTASLSGLNLPPERVAASSARLNGLAQAAKRAGDDRPIDHLRAEVYMGLTDGTYTGLSEQEILLALLAAAASPTTGAAPADLPEPSMAGVHLKARLSTVLGLDRYPAELAGWGPVHAKHAQLMAANLGAAQWRYTFTTPDGHFFKGGLTYARPVGTRPRKSSCKAVVEILVPAALLAQLADGDLRATIAPDLLAAWAPVIADLNSQLGDEFTQRLLDPRRRFPGASLRRDVVAALTRCVGVGCRVPAGATDIDHLWDHAKGGNTVIGNLEPSCRHDHRVKHEGGWQLRRSDDHFAWTTRLGHTYLTPITPVLPQLPAQRPSPPEREPPPPSGDTDFLGRPWERSDLDPEPPPF